VYLVGQRGCLVSIGPSFPETGRAHRSPVGTELGCHAAEFVDDVVQETFLKLGPVSYFEMAGVAGQ